MIVKVHEHTIEIDRAPVNELEVNVTKITFEFDETIPESYVKKAFFTSKDASIEILLENNECNIPSEVLTKKGQIRLGVIAYEVQEDQLIERFNPSPAYFQALEGSMIEADNTEPITPTDKEQIEQMLNNINIDGEKVGRITTITITYKDGTSKELILEDGKSIEYNWDGTSLGIRQEGESQYTYVNLKGDKGDAGAIKMLIVAELPATGQDDTIYLVPITPDTTGNNYAEYVYINGAWELLGKIGVQVDLTDYVKNTDYADRNKGGVIKKDNYLNLTASGSPYVETLTYAQYGNNGNGIFIGKGTLENVITGKGLINNQVNNLANYYTKTEIDNTIGDIATALNTINGENI